MTSSQVSTQLPVLRISFCIHCTSSLLQISFFFFFVYNHHPSCLPNSNSVCSFSFNVLLPQLYFLKRIFGESKLSLEVARCGSHGPGKEIPRDLSTLLPFYFILQQNCVHLYHHLIEQLNVVPCFGKIYSQNKVLKQVHFISWKIVHICHQPLIRIGWEQCPISPYKSIYSFIIEYPFSWFL